MFENYYERLVSGNVSLTASDSTGAQGTGAGKGQRGRSGSGGADSSASENTDSQQVCLGSRIQCTFG